MKSICLYIFFSILLKIWGIVIIKNKSKYIPTLVIIETLIANTDNIVDIKDSFPYIISFLFNLPKLNIIRNKATDEELENIIFNAIYSKPEHHSMDEDIEENIDKRKMNQIGG